MITQVAVGGDEYVDLQEERKSGAADTRVRASTAEASCLVPVALDGLRVLCAPKRRAMTTNEGELGLPYKTAGGVAQALGQAVVDRGNVSREAVAAYLASDAYDEDELWAALGPLVDKIEDAAMARAGGPFGPTWVVTTDVPMVARVSAHDKATAEERGRRSIAHALKVFSEVDLEGVVAVDVGSMYDDTDDVRLESEL